MEKNKKINQCVLSLITLISTLYLCNLLTTFFEKNDQP